MSLGLRQLKVTEKNSLTLKGKSEGGHRRDLLYYIVMDKEQMARNQRERSHDFARPFSLFSKTDYPAFSN